MINIDETKLNTLERKVLDSLSAHSKSNPQPKIVDAAKICGCSVSQVSKAIKKAGFKGYKQYVQYLYHGDAPKQKSLAELDRLITFTTTGHFRSFEKIIRYAESQGADVVVVSEEFNQILMDNCDRYFFLSHHNQPDSLAPYEKTRTIFFIFFEQIVQNILTSRRPAPPRSD